MKLNPLIRVACAFALLCGTAWPVHAASASASFTATQEVMGAGGTTSSSSANFALGSTAGQSATGLSTSASFRNTAGFWTASSIVFALIAQANVPIATAITSNTVTVTGLAGPAAISIVGGTYSINGAAYASATGVVNNGDTVTVRLTSSALYNAVTLATLTIDGVSGDFSVTSAALSTVTTISGPNGGTGGGTIVATLTPGAGQPTTCGFSTASQFIPLTGAPQSPPAGSGLAGVTFPYGLFDFVVQACAPGGSVTITVTYPGPVPAGARYWKFGPTASNTTPHWYVIPATFAGNTATFTITDGGLGDDDLAPNGTIVDQGGPGLPAAAVPVPTLSEWALLALAMLTGLFGWAALPRRAGAHRGS